MAKQVRDQILLARENHVRLKMTYPDTLYLDHSRYYQLCHELHDHEFRFDSLGNKECIGMRVIRVSEPDWLDVTCRGVA